MRVTERLSQTAYRVQNERSGQVYERTTSNIAPYRASGDVPKTPVGPSRYVAVRDNEETQEFWVAEVMSDEGGTLTLHY